MPTAICTESIRYHFPTLDQIWRQTGKRFWKVVSEEWKRDIREGHGQWVASPRFTEALICSTLYTHRNSVRRTPWFSTLTGISPDCAAPHYDDLKRVWTIYCDRRMGKWNEYQCFPTWLKEVAKEFVKNKVKRIAEERALAVSSRNSPIPDDANVDSATGIPKHDE